MGRWRRWQAAGWEIGYFRSEEHTSELQSRENLVCRLLLEKKKTRPPELIVSSAAAPNIHVAATISARALRDNRARTPLRSLDAPADWSRSLFLFHKQSAP